MSNKTNNPNPQKQANAHRNSSRLVYIFMHFVNQRGPTIKANLFYTILFELNRRIKGYYLLVDIFTHLSILNLGITTHQHGSFHSGRSTFKEICKVQIHVPLSHAAHAGTRRTAQQKPGHYKCTEVAIDRAQPWSAAATIELQRVGKAPKYAAQIDLAPKKEHADHDAERGRRRPTRRGQRSESGRIERELRRGAGD